MAQTKAAPRPATTLPPSGRDIIEDMTWGTVWDAAEIQYAFGGGAVLSWDSEFADLYYMAYDGPPDGAYDFVAQTEQAFAVVDGAIGLDFSRSPSPTAACNGAELVMVSGPSSVAEGIFTFPGTQTRSGSDHWSLGVISSNLPWMQVAPERGGGEYLAGVILHEIGHGLGLLHSHREETGEPALLSLGAALDNARYTVMSYKPSSWGDEYGHPVSMMALDLAVLHTLYGAEAQAVGDSTYTLTSPRQADLDLSEGDVTIGRAYYAIWDTGGTDTIVMGGAGGAVINLNAATLDRDRVAADAAPSIAAVVNTQAFATLSMALQAEIADPDYHAGGFFSRVLTGQGATRYGIDGGFSIADGAVIENATGGAGDDLLIGNEVANVLRGDRGDDTLVGGGGDDTLDGGGGTDVAAFFGGYESYEIFIDFDSTRVVHDGGVDGTDTLTNVEIGRFDDALISLSASQSVLLVGSNESETLIGTRGDRIYGLGGDDTILGGFYADTIYGDGTNPSGDRGVADLSDTVVVPGAIRAGARAVDMNEGYVTTRDLDIVDATTVPHLSAHVSTDEGFDYFTVTVDAATTLRFDIDGTQGLDTIITLYRADGLQIAQNDDGTSDQGSETDFDSMLVEQVGPGTYYLEVASLGFDGPVAMPAGAAYTLHVSNPRGAVVSPASGDDVIEGRGGGDTIDGGAGFDRASYESSDAGVTVDLAAGTATGGHAQGDRLVSIENLSGSAFADELRGDGVGNDLYGEAGNDVLRGEGGADRLFGGAGADILFGGPGGDAFDGGTGVDFVSYKDSTTGITLDLLNASANSGDAVGDTFARVENLVGSNAGDVIRGGNVANTILGRGGDDVIDGRGGADILKGEGGADELIGGEGFDRLEGGAGNDVLRGGAAVDELFGGDGADILFGGAGGDLLNGGQGFDFVSYTDATAGVVIDLRNPNGNAGDAAGDRLFLIENLVGSNRDDVVRGGNVANQVFGRNGDDIVDGRGGADLIDGGGGADTLTGGAGFDTFRYRLVGESAVGASDRITDFTRGQDVIDLSAIDADTGTAGNQAFRFVGTDAFSGSAGEVRFVSADGGVTITADVDGDRMADLAVRLDDLDAIGASDFLL